MIESDLYRFKRAVFSFGYFKIGTIFANYLNLSLRAVRDNKFFSPDAFKFIKWMDLVGGTLADLTLVAEGHSNYLFLSSKGKNFSYFESVTCFNDIIAPNKNLRQMAF